MNAAIDLFANFWNALRCVGGLLAYFLRFISVFFRSRASLAARLLAAVERKLSGKSRLSRAVQSVGTGLDSVRKGERAWLLPTVPRSAP
jgi:hypothetical protein